MNRFFKWIQAKVTAVRGWLRPTKELPVRDYLVNDGLPVYDENKTYLVPYSPPDQYLCGSWRGFRHEDYPDRKAVFACPVCGGSTNILKHTIQPDGLVVPEFGCEVCKQFIAHIRLLDWTP